MIHRVGNFLRRRIADCLGAILAGLLLIALSPTSGAKEAFLIFGLFLACAGASTFGIAVLTNQERRPS